MLDLADEYPIYDNIQMNYVVYKRLNSSSLLRFLALPSRHLA